MRGSDERSGELFSYVDLEDRIPAKAFPLARVAAQLIPSFLTENVVSLAEIVQGGRGAWHPEEHCFSDCDVRMPGKAGRIRRVLAARSRLLQLPGNFHAIEMVSQVDWRTIETRIDDVRSSDAVQKPVDCISLIEIDRLMHWCAVLMMPHDNRIQIRAAPKQLIGSVEPACRCVALLFGQ